MMSFAWRWAQVGDRVHVHQHDLPHTLVPGVVARVLRSPRRTDVAIRLDHEDSVHRIPRQYVHSDPKDPAERCPLCERIADMGAERTAPVSGHVAVV